MNNQPRPSQIVLMVSGFVAFISIFFAWWKVPSGFGSGGDRNALDEMLFPLATYIGLIGLAVLILVALDTFASVNLPDRVLSFTWTQVYLALSIFAGLLAIGFLLQDTGGLDKGIGLWLGLLGSIGLIVGSVMLLTESESTSSAPSAPPTPF